MWLNPWATKERLNPAASNQANTVMIYCVHGTADLSCSFSHIIGNLTLPDQVIGAKSVSFSRRFTGVDIEHFSNELKQNIINDGSKRVILMGHSRGGLVAAFLQSISPMTATLR